MLILKQFFSTAFPRATPKNGNSDVLLDVVTDTDKILRMLFFLSWKVSFSQQSNKSKSVVYISAH